MSKHSIEFSSRSVHADHNLMSETIEEKFRAVARVHSTRIAISDGRVELSYAEIEKMADRVARGLSHAEIKANEPIVVSVSNTAADISSFLGVWRAGGVVVPIHRSVPKVAFDALTRRIGNRFILDNGIQTISTEVPAERELLNDAGTIIFTSGSTGEPKGVVLSRTRSSAKLEMIRAMSGWSEGENALIGLQLTFSFGQWSTWLTLLNGGCVHLRGRFDPGEYQSLMEAEKIQRIPIVPTMLRQLLESGDNSAYSGQFMAGGEPLPAALGQRLHNAYPSAGIGDIYGLTETGTSDFFVQPADYDRLAGSIGHAGLHIRWRIASDTQELEINTPWNMLGYLDAPELTQSVMVDGWFRTGDLVEEMESGALRLLGRAKDVILRSGNKISPLEVEAAFLQHHDVNAALVTGVSDQQRGEAIHLALKLRSGSATSLETLRAEAANFLEVFKLPDVVHLVDELPCGSTGKADRKIFRHLIETKKLK